MSDQTVRTYLMNAIETGNFPNGTRLPTERALCEMLSVSRNAVRSALSVLEGQGRVVRIPGSGTYVAEGAARPDLAEVTSPAQVMEARLALEPQLAQLVVMNGTASDFAKMEDCVAAGAAAEGFESFEHWDAALHEAIAAATRNPVVIEAYGLVTRARQNGEWGELKRRSLTGEVRAGYQADHERILAALRKRDAEAAAGELRGHLLAIRGNLLGY